MSLDHLLNAYQDRCFKLSGLGLLKISGPESAKFLQGQLSCDVEAIPSGKGLMAAHCNPQGRVISLFYAVNINGDFYLIMPLDLIEDALSALKKYAPFFKTQLQDATGDYSITGAVKKDRNPDMLASIDIGSNLHRTIQLLPATTSHNQNSLTYDEWHMLDMIEGIPLIHHDTSAKFLPHDINLPQLNAISFSKGCYTGQEIIARMHYRGQPKKHLYRGTSAIKLTPGTLLTSEGNPSGAIIDCSQSMYNNLYPLLFTATETAVTSQQLQTEQGQFIQLQQSE